MQTLLPVVMTIISILLVGLAPIIKSLSENNIDRRRFLDTLRNGIEIKEIKTAPENVKKEEMTYSDLQHIAENFNQNRHSILSGLREMLSKATAGDKDLSRSVQKIRDLLETHQQNEPFAELPENISLQLAEIQDNPSSSRINQLAASLSTLYLSNRRSISKERNIARAGFGVGLLGIIWTVGTYFIDKQ